MELYSKLCASVDGRWVWRRMNVCVCVTETLCCSPETTTTLLIDYTLIQNKQSLKKKKLLCFYNRLEIISLCIVNSFNLIFFLLWAWLDMSSHLKSYLNFFFCETFVHISCPVFFGLLGFSFYFISSLYIRDANTFLWFIFAYIFLFLSVISTLLMMLFGVTKFQKLINCQIFQNFLLLLEFWVIIKFSYNGNYSFFIPIWILCFMLYFHLNISCIFNLSWYTVKE